MMIRHENSAQCEKAFNDQVTDAVDSSSKWFGVIFYEDRDGKLNLMRTTCNFDLGRLNDMQRLLAQNVAGEARGLDHTPLPVASEFAGAAMGPGVNDGMAVG